MKTWTFKITKFNPGEDKAPRMQTYKIKLPEGSTVLDGLIAIKAEHDGSLSFRRSCRSAICGSCACRVNGKAMLICDLQVSEVAMNRAVTLEPLDNFKIIRDLVVDLDPFFKAVEKAAPYLVTGGGSHPDKEYIFKPGDDFTGLGKVDVCVLCAACHSDCPAYKENRDWPGPVMNVKTARFILDDRDKDGSRATRSMDAGLEYCMAAEKKGCPVECPKGIDLKKSVLDVVKKAAVKHNKGKSSGI